MPIEVRTMIADAILGRMCSTITRSGEAPRAMADSMKVSFLRERVSE